MRVLNNDGRAAECGETHRYSAAQADHMKASHTTGISFLRESSVRLQAFSELSNFGHPVIFAGGLGEERRQLVGSTSS